MINTPINTPKEDLKKIGKKFKEMRLAQNLKRQTLALRSGVSESSLKRFELTGEISLKSLVKISHVLNMKDWITTILEKKYFESLDAMMHFSEKTKKRGVI
ncbi:MAG: helix-turn-helix transcriptional regulator [Pseudomonadota bacterium]